MFFIYLYVLVPGQRHASCLWLLNQMVMKQMHQVYSRIASMLLHQEDKDTHIPLLYSLPL
jgi:hypothetical protein